MIPFSSTVSRGFFFSRSSRGYEIRTSNESVGTLKRPSIWSSRYLASTRDGSWTFRCAGFLNTGAEIVDAASQQCIATFKCPWGGKGELTFADGQKFVMVSRGCWHPVWSVTTQTGEPVLQLSTREKRVEVQTTTVPDARLALLTMFTLYRIRKAEEDAGAAVVAAAIAVS